MALNLTKELRDELLADLSKAEPYLQDESGDMYDGEVDYARARATMAKMILEQYDEEHSHKRGLEENG